MGLVCQAGTPLAQKPLRIGMILDRPSRFNPQIIEVFQSEIKVVLEDENEVSFPADRILVGDWSASGIEKLCGELMDDNDVDLVIALGLISSHEFGH